MTPLERLQNLLPPPYAIAPDSLLARTLDVFALEMDVFQEDLDRLRQTHWIRFASQLRDVEKLAALLGIARLSWERLVTFRERFLALATARLKGALGPREIKWFVYDYVSRAEKVLRCLFVPGLQTVDFVQAYAPPPTRPLFRPLALVENPLQQRRSSTLQARGGRVPYLFRWQEHNRGLQDATVSFVLSGLLGGRTTVPMLVNLTTGDLLGFAGTVKFGQVVVIRPAQATPLEEPRLAAATLDDADVTGALFSMSGFTLGTPFTKESLDPRPRLPRLARGANDWIFLSVGLYDLKGLNRFFFAMAQAGLREGTFDEASFDQALFPSGPIAQLEMEWLEVEPASFEVQVPRYVVSEPTELAASSDSHPYEQVAEGILVAIEDLHAAGVRTAVRFLPFTEVQPQRIRVQLPWKVLDPEQGPAGRRDGLTLGARFGDSPLGGSRFE
jgi:hypothetical protein